MKTSEFLQTVRCRSIAEIGVGTGQTSLALAAYLNGEGELHLFDRQTKVDDVVSRIHLAGFRNVIGHGCTQKIFDSYNWSLAKLLAEHEQPLFDYVYIDGAHTWAHDALAFFLVDLLLVPGGFVEFDDYRWTMAASPTCNPQVDPRIAERYTAEQIREPQIKLVVDLLVDRNPRYVEVAEKRIFRKRIERVPRQEAKRVALRGEQVHHLVETCPHRGQVRISGGRQIAVCHQLVERSGVQEADWCHVRRDACEACCRAGAYVGEMNPVIASHLYALARRVAAAGGVPGCDQPQAAQLTRQAERHLLFVSPPQEARHQEHSGPGSVPGEERPGDQGATDERSEPLLPPTSQRRGSPVTTWAVGVTTARRQVPTIDRCLASLIAAGWQRPWVFVDGATNLSEEFLHLPVTFREEPCGPWPNFYLALHELVMRNPGADCFLMVQDDALFFDRANLREHLEANLWPGSDVGVVSLYCSSAYTRERPGWHRLDDEPWVWGALAFVFPQAAVKQFLADPVVLEHRWTEPGGDACVDVVVGQWARRNGLEVFFPTPSLVQHIGDTSTIWPVAPNRAKRISNCFLGDDRSPRRSPLEGLQ